jgi:CHAP domain
MMSYPLGWRFNAWKNWAIDQPHVWWNGFDQCVALVETHVHNLKLAPIMCAKAFEMYANASTADWEKIPNTPSFVPKAGDIVVFKEMIGSDGHAAVVRDGKSTVNWIYTIDQNWSRYHAPSLEAHRYTPEHIIGALRCKKIPAGFFD